jgi:RimJ/RimL family protein N-acetyltransferase
MNENMPISDEPIISIRGEKVVLGPFHRDLLPLLARWVNDLEVLRTDGVEPALSTWEMQERHYERISTDESRLHFAVYEREGLRPVGETNLRDIDHYQGTAEFGVLIGEKECWGQGYGTEATRLTLDYGFTVLGLHNIWLDVVSYNERGIRAYRRAGFREIGRRREAHRFCGRRYDVIWMECLATEFESPVLRRLLDPTPPAG